MILSLSMASSSIGTGRDEAATAGLPLLAAALEAGPADPAAGEIPSADADGGSALLAEACASFAPSFSGEAFSPVIPSIGAEVPCRNGSAGGGVGSSGLAGGVFDGFLCDFGGGGGGDQDGRGEGGR